MEKPIKMDDLGGFTPIFGNTHIVDEKLPSYIGIISQTIGSRIQLSDATSTSSRREDRPQFFPMMRPLRADDSMRR